MINLLVIEDEELVRLNLVDILETFNFRVFSASNGSTGISLAKEIKPDLVLCDIMMPGMNGFEVLKVFRELDELKSIPFIFLTARTEKDDFRTGMGLGADDYLTKPFTPNELVNAVNTRIEKLQLHKQAAEKKMEELSMNICSSMPHELRTPLNGILASTQLLMQFGERMGSDELREMYKNIYTSGKRLENITFKYLNYIDAELISKTPSRLEKLALAECHFPFQNLRDYFNSAAYSCNRENDLSITWIDAKINIYAEHLETIARELADNAFKFSSPGKRIAVTTWTNNGKYHIRVRDNGIGMLDEQIKNISALVQFDRKENEQQGLGLGLATVLRLVGLYKGTYSISSKKKEYTEIEIQLNII